MKTKVSKKTSQHPGSSNLNLQEVLSKLIVQEVNNGIKQKTVESGGIPISDITDIQKKGDSGIVTSINTNADNDLTCVVKLDSGQNIIVNLNTDFREIIPSINSIVTIGYDGFGIPFIQNCEYLDEYNINSTKGIGLFTGGNQILLDRNEALKGNIVINAEEYVVIRADLYGDSHITLATAGITDSRMLTEKLIDKINELIDKLNNIHTIFNSHTHPVSGASTSVTTSNAPWINRINPDDVVAKNIHITY